MRQQSNKHHARRRPRVLGLEPLEQRAVPAVSPFNISLPDSAYGIDIAETANGVRVLAPAMSRTGAPELAVYELDSTGAITRTIELASGLNTTVLQMSADGRWVQGTWFSLASVGMNPNSGFIYWDLDDPDQPIYDFTPQGLELNSLFAREQAQEARVAISYTETATGTAATLLIDGQPHVLKRGDGQTLIGSVTFVESGIGGDPLTWIAIGDDQTNGSSQKFIAFADGSVMSLPDFFYEQSGQNGSFIVHPDIVRIAVTGDSIFFLNNVWSSPPCNGMVCGNVINLVGNSLTGLPLPEAWTYSTLDVSADRHIRPSDALEVINAINSQTRLGIPHGQLPSTPYNTRIDVNHDGLLTAVDALRIINFLNAQSTASINNETTGAEGEGSGTSRSSLLLAATDDYFLGLAQPRRKK